MCEIGQKRPHLPRPASASAIPTETLHGTTPASAIKIGTPRPTNIRQAALRFGELLDRAPIFTGTEEPAAWHNNCSEAQRLFGDSVVDLDTMIRWNADWLRRGLPFTTNARTTKRAPAYFETLFP